MEHRKIGFAFCGSFCTYSQAMEVLERVQSRYGDVLPIVSEAGAATDTRFGAAHDFMREMERICGRRVMDSIAKGDVTYTFTPESYECVTGTGETIELTHYCYVRDGFTYIPMDFAKTL